jgi:uncharacterized repeat protein (TIGR03809 family)
MTHRADVARGRDIVTRWCNLAERRLEYLTGLFETGRWRRYYSERVFLENIQEAKAAVETWRDLLTREASLENSTIDLSWLGRARSTLPLGDRFSERLQRNQPPPVPVQIAPAPSEPMRSIRGDVLVALESQLVVSDKVPAAPALDEMRLPVLDRYPLLRNTL